MKVGFFAIFCFSLSGAIDSREPLAKAVPTLRDRDLPGKCDESRRTLTLGDGGAARAAVPPFDGGVIAGWQIHLGIYHDAWQGTSFTGMPGSNETER
jgi:hypothetical protein